MSELNKIVEDRLAAATTDAAAAATDAAAAATDAADAATAAAAAQSDVDDIYDIPNFSELAAIIEHWHSYQASVGFTGTLADAITGSKSVHLGIIQN